MPQKVNLELIYEKISHNNEMLTEIKVEFKEMEAVVGKNTAHRQRQTTINKMIAGGFGALTTVLAVVGKWI